MFSRLDFPQLDVPHHGDIVQLVHQGNPQQTDAAAEASCRAGRIKSHFNVHSIDFYKRTLLDLVE